MKNPIDIENLEIALFQDALLARHGYDFRHYAKASLKRRITDLAAHHRCQHISELIPRLIHQKDFLAEVLASLSVPVTEMFRDPSVFRALTEQVLPQLATYPLIQIWQAGCATGEEVYSLAILLEEAGLLKRARLYATDINDQALRRAEDGIFPADRLEEYSRNYLLAGGRQRLSDYYVSNGEFFRMNERLRERIVFAHHNLVADGVFCEVQLILCRNVLIYFDNTLQARVLTLFHDALVRNGFLCLGSRESLRAADAASSFEPLVGSEMIFRRGAVEH